MLTMRQKRWACALWTAALRRLTYQIVPPSNPIHKEAMKAQGMGGQKKEATNKQADPAPCEQAAPLPNKEVVTPMHDTNKIMTVVAAIGVAGLLVFSFSRKS